MRAQVTSGKAIHMETTPPRGTQFTCQGWKVDGQTVRFAYHCDVYGEFEEQVSFPRDAQALSTFARADGGRLLDLLGVALGVSYYKLAAAKFLHLPPLTTEGRAMAEALYTEGLAEFYVRNNLPYPADLVFEGEMTPSGAGTFRDPGAALVAFGGGKDSYVARAILEEAGDTTQLVSAVLGPSVKAALESTAPSPLLFLDRRLSPHLYEIAPKAFGGHVPITAINMLMLVVLAELTGRTQIIFANERSADEPTMTLPDGSMANHQYSKSSAFEGLLRHALVSAYPSPPLLYSLLRPYSELWIGKVFSILTDAFPKFTSCNRNFRIAGEGRVGWCGECAKCAFTSLILSPYITADTAVRIFGENFLNRDALMPLYEQLLGLSDQKPWDCVGTIDECRAALWYAATQGEFAETKAAQTFLPPLLTAPGETALSAAWEAAKIPDTNDVIPTKYLDAASRLFA